MHRHDVRARLALAFDLPLPEALSLYDAVATYVAVAKVGLSLFVEHGPRAVQSFLTRGAQVFLDIKLHDIPNTVELAAARAGALGVSYLTVHASGGQAMLERAIRGARAGAQSAGHPPPKILAVTVLTSMDNMVLEEIGVSSDMQAQIDRLGALASASGIDGLVCSPLEVSRLRASVGRHLFFCTPGIRPLGEALGDQCMVATPAVSIAAGADLLVVGRPIYAAPQPHVAARLIAEEVARALQ